MTIATAPLLQMPTTRTLQITARTVAALFVAAAAAMVGVGTWCFLIARTNPGSDDEYKALAVLFGFVALVAAVVLAAVAVVAWLAGARRPGVAVQVLSVMVAVPGSVLSLLAMAGSVTRGGVPFGGLIFMATAGLVWLPALAACVNGRRG